MPNEWDEPVDEETTEDVTHLISGLSTHEANMAKQLEDNDVEQLHATRKNIRAAIGPIKAKLDANPGAKVTLHIPKAKPAAKTTAALTDEQKRANAEAEYLRAHPTAR